MASREFLPMREKARLVGIVAAASLVLLRQAFVGLLQHRIGSYAYKVNIYGPVLQYVFTRVTESHRRALGQPASSGETVQRYCKKHGLEFHVQKASQHASLYWIGKPPQGPDSKILFYLHGGGYFHAVQPGHIKFLHQCVSHVRTPISVVILEYTLTTESPWPAQLQSALSGINLLLKDYSPSQIILGGDSAGGHLILSLLSHILHPEHSPCSGTPTTPLTEPFAGAFLMSPWVTTATSAPSYDRLAKRDHLTVGRINRFTEVLLASHKPTTREVMLADPFLSPLNAPQGWWHNLSSAVNKLQLTVGTWEVFLDDDVAMSQNLLREAKDTDIRFSECYAAIHSGSIVDAALGIRDSTMSKAIWKWMNDVLG